MTLKVSVLHEQLPVPQSNMSKHTAQAWTWTTSRGGLIENLTLNEQQIPASKPDHILIDVLNVSVNPGDLKFPKLPLVPWFLKYPASLCFDFCGRIVKLPDDLTKDERNLHIGQEVFGLHRDLKTLGTLKTKMWVHKDSCWPVPEGVPVEHASGYGVAGVSAFAALGPFAKSKGKVLITGGSGGVGTMCIQVAKALDMYVIATCSQEGKQLCLDLGADETLDYKSATYLDQLAKLEADLVVDNVGNDVELHRRSEKFLKVDGNFVLVAMMDHSWAGISSMLVSWLLPAWLGGPARRWQAIFSMGGKEKFRPVADLMGAGRLKVVLDSVYSFSQAPEALRRIQSGRAKGKVIVQVAQ